MLHRTVEDRAALETLDRVQRRSPDVVIVEAPEAA